MKASDMDEWKFELYRKRNGMSGVARNESDEPQGKKCRFGRAGPAGEIYRVLENGGPKDRYLAVRARTLQEWRARPFNSREGDIMFNRYLTSSFLAAAVVSMSLIGCGRSDDNRTTSTPPRTDGPAERAGERIDNAGRNTADAARDAANRTGAAMDRTVDRTAAGVNNTVNNGTTGTTDRTAAGTPRTSDSNMPGMPSVTGTSTTGMTTADAAAQRLIDNARNNIKQNDVGKAKTLLAELKEKGMYDSLSSTQKSNVDKLEQEINAAPGATVQENR
jgi:hypothetical protein